MANWMDNLPRTERGDILLASDIVRIGDRMTVHPTTLAKMVGNAANYVELSALPIASEGWQPYFDEWKAKGHIN